MPASVLAFARNLALTGAVAVLPLLTTGQAHATPINGSDSIIALSVKPQGGSGDLLSATGFKFTGVFWGDGANDFAPVQAGDFVTISSAVLTVGSLGSYSFTSADGNFAAAPSMVIGGTTYTSGIVASSGSIAAGSESLSFFLVGTFTPSGALSGLDANNASETISFTETGISASGFGSFSVSATFASPAIVAPPTNAPEPASLLLLGAGILGLGSARRRKA